jgi:hypothetical protein
MFWIYGVKLDRAYGINNPENGAKPTSEGATPIVKILNGERHAEHGKLRTRK